MKRILEYIKNKNREFACANIFSYLADNSIDPYQRLVFAPYMAHFVFSFMDINRFVLRDLASDETLQHLVNIHTDEDANHWPWYLEDLRRLGLDKPMLLSDSLRFIWGDHCIKSRLLTYRLSALVSQATAKEKVMIVEVIEMTGNIFLRHTVNVCKPIRGGENYQYFGTHHYQCETGHHMGSTDIEAELHRIDLNASEITNGIRLIDQVYSLYQEFVDEMWCYAMTHRFDEHPLQSGYTSTITTSGQSTGK